MSDYDQFIAALKKGATLSTEPAPTASFPAARKLSIGFADGNDADDALAAISRLLAVS